MSQKLILPLNKCKVTAGYKNQLYLNAFKYNHYGIDYADGQAIIASGNGTVIATGYDNVLGNIIVARYNACELPSGAVKDLIIRYCHLSVTNVKTGTVLTQGLSMGTTGQTPIGKINGVHLHVEVDTDINYPMYTPTISKTVIF